MSDTLDRLADLRTHVVRIVRQATGLNELLAVPVAQEIVRELQRQCGGAALYVPAPSRQVRDQEIRDALALGRSIGEIVRLYGVSRATVYRAMATTKACPEMTGSAAGDG